MLKIACPYPNERLCVDGMMDAKNITPAGDGELVQGLRVQGPTFKVGGLKVRMFMVDGMGK